MNKCELLAPAGNLYKLKIAVKYGADAIYIGGEEFSLRVAADNFTKEEMIEGINYAHEYGRKVYITANIIARNHDLPKMREYFKEIYDMGADAVIISDLGAFMICREVAPDLEIHVSTQANNTNYETVKAWYNLGAKRVVLAREMSIREVKEIRDNIPSDCDLEAFVHGAMCISYSGRCLLSNYMTHRDSNRGACAHPCRWNYALMEETREGQYFPVYENERGTFIMNSKDLCMIDHVKELCEAGVYSFKIEGRVKSEYYVATIISAYRRAIDDYYNGKEYNPEHFEEICKVSHRDYYPGFFFGMPPEGAQVFGSNSYIRDWDIVGLVCEYDEKTHMAKVKQRNRFFKGDEIEIMRPGMDNYTQKAEVLMDEDFKDIDVANHAAATIYIKLDEPTPPDSMIRKRKEEN